MGRHGDGSITRRPDGRYQVSIQISGKRLFAYAKTKAEAAAKLRELRRQAALGAVGREAEALALSSQPQESAPVSEPEIPTKTVGDLIRDWLALGDLKRGTKKHYELIARVYIQPHIGDIPISQLRPQDIQELYMKLGSPSVIDKVHRILHRAFRIAVLWGVLAENPCDKAVKPRYRANGKKIWGTDELKRFLEGARGHWLYPLWLLAITTGCRLGELLALRWGDIDLKAGTMTISRTLTWVDGSPTFEAPKTPAANRTLELLPEAAQVLESIRDSLGDIAPDTLVFPGPKGGRPMYPSVVQHALKKECRRLGLPEMTPHGLRHLHASLLLSRGVPIPLVSRQLGHANPAVTMQIYAHVVDIGNQVTEALSGLLNGDPGEKRGEG